MPNTEKHSNIKVHFFYVTLILVAIIILLVAAKWTELTDFTSYLSTAATVTSLVLGLLAIIYAYISNNALSETVGAVSEASSTVSQATTKISSLLEVVDIATAKTTKSNDQLHEVMNSLKGEITELGETAELLEVQTKKISEILPELPRQFRRLEAVMQRSVKAITPIVTKGSKALITQEEAPKLNVGEKSSLAKYLVDTTSPNGLLLIYACYLSQQKNMKFTIDKIVDASRKEYLVGFYTAISSIPLMEVDEDKDEILVKKCPSEFGSVLNEAEERIKLLETGQQEQFKEYWDNAIAMVEKAFEGDVKTPT